MAQAREHQEEATVNHIGLVIFTWFAMAIPWFYGLRFHFGSQVAACGKAVAAQSAIRRVIGDLAKAINQGHSSVAEDW